MGILSKKEVKRPMQEVGLGNHVTWYQDTNEIFIYWGVIKTSLHSFNIHGKHLPKEKVNTMHFGTGDVTLEKLVHEIYLLNYQDLFEYLLVYLELPEPVEELFIAKYKEFKRQIALIQDKINQKRKKLL